MFRHRGRSRATLVALLSAAIALGLAAAPAGASFPGRNGLIAFASPSGIWVMSSGGSGQRLLADTTFGDAAPSFSPNGRTILFTRPAASGRPQIWETNVAGTSAKRLSRDSANDEQPSFSPNGRKIVFWRYRRLRHDGTPESQIWEMNSDGTHEHQLTHDAGFDIEPSFAPSGRQIAFARDSVNSLDTTVLVMGANGSGERPLGMDYEAYPSFSADGTRLVFIRTDPIGAGYGMWVAAADGSSFLQLTRESWGMAIENPSFSPDDRQIVFDRHSSPTGPPQIFIVRADGSHRRQLTHLAGGAEDPTWGPR